MNSIHARLLSTATVVLLLFVIVTAWVMLRADQDRLLNAVDTRLQGLVYGVLGATELTADGDIIVESASLPNGSLAQAGSGHYAIIQDESGEIVWKSDSIIQQLPILDTAAIGEWLTRRDDDYIGSGFGVRWYVEDKPYRITLWALEASSLSQQQADAFATTLVIWLAILSLLLLVTLYLVLRWAAAPIIKLGKAVDAVRAGECHEIDAIMPRELDTVKVAVNRLLQHEHRRQMRYRNTLDDLAHSLKTPLAVLSNDAYAANDQSRLEQLQRIDEILSYHLTRAITSEATAFAEPLSIAPVLRRICDSLQRVYGDKSVITEINCPHGLSVSCDEKLVFEIAGNLIDNAFKWARTKVTVQCHAQHNNGMTAICINDDGPGFDGQDTSIYLQRGVRADQRIAGQGIGLAVVDQLVRELGGEISLSNSAKGGATVIFMLPSAPSV